MCLVANTQLIFIYFTFIPAFSVFDCWIYSTVAIFYKTATLCMLLRWHSLNSIGFALAGLRLSVSPSCSVEMQLNVI